MAKSTKERAPGVLLDNDDIKRALKRVAHEIVERNRGTSNVVLIGIHSRGVPIAARIGAALKEIEGAEVPTGALDIALYRDDYSTHSATPHRSAVPFDMGGKTVVLVDDVLFTGRTVRAALDALNDYGRPAAVQLAVLVDRGHRELPIRADFVGKNVPTAREEKVTVHLQETDGENIVRIEKKTSAD
ncbi:MAG TPA: bifunctional pyr operon transcriptional regulator/uracil phosphoribosyltransferase PyrR [Abditibacteriaceae bacterium]|jgi:pyrimidine operon attenuation protein/uracil phosphoribosyltransferase